MEKNIISFKQAVNTVVAFLIGSTAVLGFGVKTRQDSWVCLIIAMILSIPIVLLYSKILNTFPGKNLYEILDKLFGKIGGKIISIIYILYSFQLGTLVARNFTEFIQIVSLDRTPQIIIAAFLIITCFFILKNGFEILGRLSIIFLFTIIVVLSFSVIFLLKDMKIENIRPVFEHDFKQLFLCSIPIVGFPFAECVVFLGILSPHIRPQDNLKKIFIISIIISGGLLLIALFRNIFVLDEPTLEILYFPSYSAFSKLQISDFFARAEILIATNFLMAGIVKSGICLYSATKGVAHLFNIKDYKLILAPISLLMITFCGFIYENTMQMMEFAKVATLYFLIIQIVIPIIIYVTAQIKNKIEHDNGHKVDKKAESS